MPYDDDPLDQDVWRGTLFDRHGWYDPAKDARQGRCAMATCPYGTDDEHKYCETCRSIWPDLSLLLAVSIEKARKA